MNVNLQIFKYQLVIPLLRCILICIQLFEATSIDKKN